MRALAWASLLSLLPLSAVQADDGCAAGTFTVIPGDRMTILFDNFVSEAGVPTGLVTDSSVCNLTVPVDVVDGFAVYTLDYRTGIEANPGQRIEVIDLNTGATVVQVDGPASLVLIQGQIVATNPGSQLAISTALIVDAGANPDLVQGAIDSLDVLRIGLTTEASVQASLNQIANEQTAVGLHLMGGADLLLGFLQPLRRSTEVGAFAAAGSPMAGATGNLDVPGGLSLFGGLAGFDQNAGGAGVGGALLAGGGRFVYALDETFDLFAEASVWGSPNLGLRFTRQYSNNGAMVTGAGSSTGSLFAFSGRIGAAFTPDEANQFVASASFAQSRLNLSGYAEGTGANNLFAATIAGRTVEGNLVKATASWTGMVTPDIDVTLSGAIGRTFGGSNTVPASVSYVGNRTGTGQDVTFFEYGARLGWSITPNATLDAFVFGTTGDKIGSQARFGGSLSVKF